MSNYLVWGGGGHGKVVANVARAAGFSITGFVDANPEKLHSTAEPGGARVVLLESDFLVQALKESLPGGVAGVILAVGNNSERSVCRQKLSGSVFPVVVHPSAIVADNVFPGQGTVVMSAAVINSNAKLGSGVIVNTGAVIEHDCEIGDDSHLAPGSILSGGVKLGARVLVGAGAVIIPGVTVGNDAVIGAGAVVLHDVPEGATVAGNPAKQITSKK